MRPPLIALSSYRRMPRLWLWLRLRVAIEGAALSLAEQPPCHERPLRGAFHPFTGPIRKAGTGRTEPFAVPSGNGRYLRQAALRGRPAEGIKSPQSGGCGNQFVEFRWPYLDGLVSLDGHVVGAGLGIRWRRAVVGARGRKRRQSALSRHPNSSAKR